MHLKHWFVLGMVMLVAIGCVSESTANSAGENIQESELAQEREDEGAESPIAQAEPIQIAAEVVNSGEFVSGEHPTQGTVQIIQEEGATVVELGDSFQTTRGPDLFVILHRSPDVIGSTTPPDYPIAEGDYAILAPLASPSGTQRYEVPTEINVGDYASVAIWCRQFNATFGAATLQ
ncbi:hypothetical protein C7B61_02560 [filamentous cyanobacterium CCP1]|nr:hypothetical protein C7B76_20740 [filamentous cyanobacterium CCP2]PSB68118.1 hypothetical protein C7B61_02560 [filamentous cyanobacterium CCP1]